MHVHMAWMGDGGDQAQAQAEKIAAANPDCTITLHTDGREVWEPWRATYDAVHFNRRMQSDILRHSLLRRYGGLWLDVDVQPLVPLRHMVAGFCGYTAVALLPSGWVGTDIIYVDETFDGWSLFDDYIARQDVSKLPLSALLFAHTMLMAVRRAGGQINILRDPLAFPCNRGSVSQSALALRCRQTLPAGLGDLVAAGLAAIGITKERAQAVAQALGIEDCGCPKRQAALNRLGQKLGLPPGSSG